METFVQWLKSLKSRTGWTNEKIGAKCGVSATAVGGWLSGAYAPKVPQVQALAELAGVDWRWLAALVAGQVAGDGAEISPELARLLDTARSLTPGELARITAAIEALYPQVRDETKDDEGERAEIAC